MKKLTFFYQLVSFQQQIADNNEGLIALIGHLGKASKKKIDFFRK